jgi:lipoprotein-releasing system ATP-binding protein
MNETSPVLSCQGLGKRFVEGANVVEVLLDVELEVMPADRLAIVGASGSGKTTLLQLLGGLDLPTKGSVSVQGRELSRLSDAERGRLRNRALGSREAAALLERVGLGERLAHRPAKLSGGERQRAAVARALITRPAVVLADEPTGNLDARTGQRVFDLMLELNRELGTALVVVTHDLALARRMGRMLELVDGRLQAA